MTTPTALARLLGLAGPPGPADQARPGPPAIDLAAERRIAEQAAALAAWARDVPPKFRHARLDRLDRHGPEVIEPVRRWVTSEAWADGVNLVVVGPVGVGKTLIGLAAARALVEQGKHLLFRPVGELARDLDWRADGHRAAALAAAEADVLMLDDLGIDGTDNEWMRRQLFDIVNYRWNHDLPTIGTGNVTSEQLAELLGERTHSRLVGAAVAVRVTGPDQRRARP